ncbi:MAG: acyl--CoA ligase [Alicyclobacillus sp.]|nr:acyl--CoA ligase [Alicyclobacillus sp.]
MWRFPGMVLTEARAQDYLARKVWTEESFIDVLQATASAHPDLVHRDEQRSLTYQALWAEVESVAAAFYDLGVRKGDRVAVQLPNVLDYVVAVFAAARLGAVAVLLQIDLGREALHFSLSTSAAKVWVVADSFRGEPLLANALALRSNLPDLQQIVVQGEELPASPEVLRFADLRASGRRLSEAALAAQRPGPLDPYVMVFTSGTTGSPKGVVHLHANYLWVARAYARWFGYEAGQAVLDLAPICHQTGMLAGVMMTVASGGRILLLDRFSAQRVLQWMETEKPSYVVGAPPHVIHLANAPGLRAADTSSVRLLIYAGAPVPSEVLRRLQEEGGIRVAAMFGWTEGFLATATRPDDPIEAASTTVGYVIPGTEVRLVDEDGRDVPPGTPGEMLCRGPNFSAGYFNNPAASARQWDQEGWFHSGDLLRQDEAGRFIFLGRVDDIINRGGTKIDPKSIEDAISAHPAVLNVAVVGAPDPTLGQQTVACIILREGHSPFSLAELRDFLGQRGLAKFQFPDRIEFMTELPTTHSGKIKKKELRERLLQEVEGR